MERSLQLNSSVKTTTRLTQWTLLLIFVMLGAATYLQTNLILKAGATRHTPTDMFVQSMETRLNGISNGIMTYLQNHDNDSLERIKSEGREASRLLGEYKQRPAREGVNVTYAQMERAYESIRSATLELLASEHAVLRQLDVLKESDNVVIALLNDRMLATVRPNQLNASARIESVQMAMDQVRSLPKSHDSRDLALTQDRFRRAIGMYEELSRTRRAEHWADHARLLFGATMANAQAWREAEDRKRNALENFTQERNGLDVLLRASIIPAPIGFQMPSLKEGIASGLAYVSLVSVLLIIGVVLIWRSSRKIDRHLAQPLREILQCVEAASTGDMSRIPEHWSGDEVGQLSQAVGRLINVLSRSENLVYHLAALVESTGEAIISHNLDGTILSWNKGAQRIYGYSAEEVKGQRITILSPYDDGVIIAGILQKIRNGDRIHPFETIHQARNGRQVRALVRVSAILDSKRSVIGASFCAQDLSEAGLLKTIPLEIGKAA